MQSILTRRDRSKRRPAALCRLAQQLFGRPALVASHRMHAFEAAYELARERPALAGDLLRTRAAEQTDRCAGLRAGLRDERAIGRHTTRDACGAGGERR